MIKQSLYKKNQNGKTLIWSIWVEEVIPNELYNIRTEDGIFPDGKMKGSSVPISKGLGKNSIYEQAVKDAQSVYAKKLKKGGSPDVNNLKESDETATIKEPMKAETFKPYPKDDKEAKKTFTIDRAGIRGKKVIVDRKLDGWRLRVVVNKTDVKFYTSSGDLTLPFPQIENQVRKVFDKNVGYWESKYGVTEHILDGEIYRHELQAIRDKKDNVVGHFFQPNTSGFAATASATGSVKNITPEKQKLRDLMQFHLFDIAIEDKTVLDDTRQKIIQNYHDGKNVIVVEKFNVIAEEQNFEDLMKQFLNEGYEGLMIKIPGTPYEFKRSKSIMKYKPVIDDEFQISGFKESINGGTLGSIICTMDDGQEFSATPMDDFGTDAMKQIIWDNQSDYLGKMVTCIFLEYTPDGIPRHPRVKGFRKGKSKD